MQDRKVAIGDYEREQIAGQKGTVLQFYNIRNRERRGY